MAGVHHMDHGTEKGLGEVACVGEKSGVVAVVVEGGEGEDGMEDEGGFVAAA